MKSTDLSSVRHQQEQLEIPLLLYAIAHKRVLDDNVYIFVNINFAVIYEVVKGPPSAKPKILWFGPLFGLTS